MSILEDLDLMDLLDELPEGSDFDLDDILFEFSTPGLFAAPEEPKTESEPVAEVVEIVPEPIAAADSEPDAVPETVIEEQIPEIVAEDPAAVSMELAEEPTPVVDEAAPVAVTENEDDIYFPDIAIGSVFEEEESIYEHSDNTLFGDSLGVNDILFEFGSSLNEAPAVSVQPTVEDEDDVKVYTPEQTSDTHPAAVVPSGDTVVFDTPDSSEEAVQPNVTASAQAKAPGFFAKAAAAVKGLFATKKVEKTIPETKPVEADYLSLFTAETPAEELSVMAVSEETEEVVATEEIEVFEEAEPVAEEIVETFSAEEEEEEIPVIAEADDVSDCDDSVPVIDLDELLDEAAELPVILAEESEPQETLIEEMDADFDDGLQLSAPHIAADILPEIDSDDEDNDLLFTAEDLSLSEEDDDDVKVYMPEEASAEAAINTPNGGTIVFEPLDLTEEPAPAEVVEQPKAPGFFQKAVALVMGLFASKKAEKTVAAASQQDEDENVTLFDIDYSAEEIPAIAFTEEVSPAVFEEETLSETDLLFLFADEELDMEESLPVTEAEEPIPAVETEEIVPVIEEEETLPVIEAEEIIPEIEDVEDNISIIEAEEISPVIEEEETVPVIEAEPTPVIAEESVSVDWDITDLSSVLAEETDTVTGTDFLFSDSDNLDDILFEIASSDIETEENLSDVYSKEPAAVSEEDDIKVYVPDVLSAEESSGIQDGGTIIFEPIDLSEIPTPSAEKNEQPKAPGFFQKAAGLVMGLFTAKKAAKAVSAAVQPTSAAASEDDPFANLTDLFNEANTDEMSDIDDLMLELQIEREAEKEAELAAREAAERLAREEEQKALELEAQRLAQAEADAEAEARRLKEEEDARMKAETDALLKQLQAEEEERQALAEEELFDWIEAAEKRREAAAAAAEIPEEPVSFIDESVPETTIALQVPALDEEPVAEQTPVYDFTSVELPTQEETYNAPQISIDINEDAPEEVSNLLEMPNIDQDTSEPEETPEEAAARKKKEDDELHYKPEESTAKTVTSHIGKRFGAAFTAFTNSDDSYDDEEALGPEVDATKAYRFFSRFIAAYRFRLRISVVLCVILGWISLGLPVFGSLKNPAVAATMCLMILLTVMLAGADVLATGVRNLLRKRPTIHSLVAISCFASVVDAIVIIATKGVSGYLPFCGVSAISMCFAIYGSLLYCRSQRLNFKTLSRATEPMTISVDHDLLEKDTSTVYRTAGYPEEYIHRSEEEDLSETVFGLMAPIMIPAILVLALIATLFSTGFSHFFHILAAMFAAAASFGALIAFPLPYFLVQKELYSTKAALAGWAGIRDIGRVSSMIVTDRDLFPDDTVSIEVIRIMDTLPPQLTLSHFCSIILHSNSCLVPAFTQLAEKNNCEIREVENFQCHESSALTCTIGPDTVMVADSSYLKLQGFKLPQNKKNLENTLFLVVNDHLIAFITINYKPIKSVRSGLLSALRGNVEMIFAARDFNVTPLLISKKFKSATETLRFPSLKQRYEITSQVNSETSACAAVVYRKSFYSFALVVEKARYLYNSVSWGVILSAVSAVMGVLLMFIMALTGGATAITVGRLLVFMLLWLIPTLALTVSITK